MNNPQKGINYDTGFDPYGPNYTSRKAFDLHVVRREMEIIATDLQCTHVRITGSDLERIAIAAQLAVEAGLCVWFSPFPCNLTKDQLLSYFVASATLAENIRLIAPETVLVLGCELSLFDTGFLPGAHLLERSQAFTTFEQWQPAMDKNLNELFASVLPDVRQAFHGSVTYAAGEWEEIDWSIFDIVSIDLYRAQHNEATYQQQVLAYGASQKPVAITEFGCCALQSAASLGGNATFAVLSMQDGTLAVNEGWQYSEDEQVNYFQELLQAFKKAGVLVAFWFTFADYEKPYSDDPRHNLDMASYGVVQVRTHKGETYPDMNWEPRKVFHALRNA
jgi:hypothetical protein